MFMNSADNVGVQNQVGGLRVVGAFLADPTGEWWNSKSLPARYRGERAKQVMEAVAGSGTGGQYSAAELGRAAYNKSRIKRILNDNIVARGSRAVGERVEMGVRAGMALDTIMREGSVAEATQRITRIHFNYSDVSEMDEMMRRIIPFWTFMSRNVPLQVQQLWTNPRAYLHYQSAVRNFREPGDDSDLPRYMRQGGAFRVGKGTALMPDVGITQLSSQVEQLSNPQRMLSQLNPAIKVPLQQATNQNFFYGNQYEHDDFQKLPAELGPFAPLLAMLGRLPQTPGGENAVATKDADSIRDIFPMLAQVNRLGGTSPNREGMEGQALLNWLGVPVKQITPDVLERERRRRRGSEYYRNVDEQERARALAGL
jgi:hypothetical protein